MLDSIGQGWIFYPFWFWLLKNVGARCIYALKGSKILFPYLSKLDAVIPGKWKQDIIEPNLQRRVLLLVSYWALSIWLTSKLSLRKLRFQHSFSCPGLLHGDVIVRVWQVNHPAGSWRNDYSGQDRVVSVHCGGAKNQTWIQNSK